jgi:hypothetical protein
VKFTYQGRVYEYQEDKLPLADAIALKHHTGMTPKAFYEGLGEMDPDSLRSMVFFALRHAGESPKWDSVDFDIFELAESMDRPAEEVPPPGATGATQWPGDTTTSDLSPTT